jgi:pyridoxamine 5'-phosphate oxidase
MRPVTDPRAMQAPTGTHEHGALRRADLDPDPIEQFRRWLADADAAGIPLANAIALATADADGAPSVRHVLLRGVEPDGFVFYTNHASHKGHELAVNPRAAFTVLWRELDRQVGVRGRVTQVPAGVSDDYFATRPREAQIGAWASHQSEPLADRAELERRLAEATARFDGDDVPRPSFWGGYHLFPEQVEFWQGRRFRLHDRFRYARDGAGWRIERLSP